MLRSVRVSRIGVRPLATAAGALLFVLAGTGASSAETARVLVGRSVAPAIVRDGTARVVVAFRERPSHLTLRGTIAAVRAQRARVLARVPTDGFRVTAGWDAVPAVAGEITRLGLAELASDPEVARIDLDVGGAGTDAESSALIGAGAVQAAGITGAGVTVAVLDSGLNRSHPDLADSIVGEHCFVPPSGCPSGGAEQDGPGSAQDDNGHGTNVTGIVTSNGTASPLGVAPAAAVVAVKVLDRNNRFDSVSQIVSALNWIVLQRPDVKVVNMSLGTDALFAGACDDAAAWTVALAAAVRALTARGTTVVASAGNEGSPTMLEAPACIQGVIAVGAVYDAALGSRSFLGCTDGVTAADQVACFSNSGQALDLLAPGALVTSTGLGSTTSTYAGTSQAAPHVSAGISLMLQADPSLDPTRVEALLKATGEPILDPRNGLRKPRIDLAAAYAGLGTRTPVFGVTPRALPFGRVRVGRSKSLRLTVRNTGTAALTVAARVVRAPFSLRTPSR